MTFKQWYLALCKRYSASYDSYEDLLQEAFKAGAKQEREACANFVVNEYVRQFEKPWREDLADAIRARGEA